MFAGKAPRDTGVGIWLLCVCALVVAMILVGGATRLTDSGLSITEWDLGKGVVPPLSDAAWAEEFALYRQTTEYQVVNQGMSLSEFQYIYFWEWGHRFLGKVIGLVFAIPYFFFLATGRLKGRLGAVTALFALGGLQGAIGWWMVTSGLGDVDRVDVSSVRLAVHLGMAFAIIGIAYMLALQALGFGRDTGVSGGAPRWAGLFYVKLLFVQIIVGALVAGIDAGRSASDWPTMLGQWFPAAYAQLEPFSRNLIENGVAAQFNHRVLGYLVMALGLWISLAAMLSGPGHGRTLGALTAVLLTGQVALGIATVVNHAPLWLCLLHQGGAVALWLASLALLVLQSRREPVTASEAQARQAVAQGA
jgi:heme a synthase